MKTCRITGSPLLAVWPSGESSVGTSLQPEDVLTLLRGDVRKQILQFVHDRRGRAGETPSRPRMPQGRVGSCSGGPPPSERTGGASATACPAPSPVLTSHPQAPRCSRLITISNACWTSLWDRSPLMLTTNPTPQESRSLVRAVQPLLRRGRGGELNRPTVPCAHVATPPLVPPGSRLQAGRRAGLARCPRTGAL